MDNSILVLGGTGAMGAHLVQLLADDGIETVVTTRKYRKSRDNITYIQGNAHDTVFLKNLLKGQHYDAIVDFMVYSTVDFYERMELSLDATKQYVFLSSARVYSDQEHLLTEKTPRLLDVSQDKEFLQTDEYALAKARQEDLLCNSGRKNWTIIRPYITYSEKRLQLGVLEKEEWLYRALHGKTIVFSSDIYSKQTTLTYGLDVSRGIQSIIGNLSALGEIFHITSKESYTWGVILTIYMDILEKHLGYRPSVLLADLNEFLEFRPKGAKYQIIYDRLFNRVFDNSKIAQYIDTDDFVELEKGITSCLKNFLKIPQFNDINWRMEAKFDRKLSERTSLKEIYGLRQKIKYLIYRYL